MAACRGPRSDGTGGDLRAGARPGEPGGGCRSGRLGGGRVPGRLGRITTLLPISVGSKEGFGGWHASSGCWLALMYRMPTSASHWAVSTDPSICPPAHDWPPSANSPVSTHWLMGALPPRTLNDHGLTSTYAI